MTEPEKLFEKEPVKLNDVGIRLIGIPAFGLSIPYVSGLLQNVSSENRWFVISHLYFILLSALIWQGNRYLLFRTRKRFTWFHRPIEKLILLVINNVFYTAPLTTVMLAVWYHFMELPIDWPVIKIVTLINIICVLFVTHVYETVFLLKEQQQEQMLNAELQRAKAEAELISLRNQVDPHFMFNSLNTLSYLIETDPINALKFTEALAEIYRYILNQKDRTLVLLTDELDFTKKYTELLRLRFGNGLLIHNHLSSAYQNDYLIPPNSVFMAFENAVKHNEISEQHPLNIEMKVQQNELIISNSVRRRNSGSSSLQIGLKNLDERFRLITGKKIKYEIVSDTFTLSIPLIPLSN